MEKEKKTKKIPTSKIVWWSIYGVFAVGAILLAVFANHIWGEGNWFDNNVFLR